MEDRRWRRVAFEETARSILRYPEDSEDLKVIVTELQERLGMSKKQVSPSSKLPCRQETRTATFLKFSGKEKKIFALPAWPDGTRS